MSNELLPCPFCGSNSIQGSDGHYGAFWCVCTNCGASTSEVGVSSQEEANARWNKRAVRVELLDLAHEIWAMAQGPQPIEEACAKIAQRLRSCAVPAGWKLVPEDPTEPMFRAMTDPVISVNGDNRNAFTRAYQDLLAAAPTYTGEKE